MQQDDDAVGHGALLLRSGERISLRPIQPDDAPRLQALAPRLSDDTLHFRFFGSRRVLRPEEAARLATVDGRARAAIVAVRATDDGPTVIGVARYDGRDGATPPTAEFAIVVEDAYQRLGVGRALLSRLVALAQRSGFQRLDGDMLADNEPMRRFVHGAGFPVTFRSDGAETHFSWDISAHTLT